MIVSETSDTASWASSPGVRSRMRLQRSRDTGPEMAVRRELFRRGFRYRVHYPVPGLARRRIDIAFTRAKVAVFVDGCFWHGCPEHGNPAVQANREYWDPKIARNRERDADTDRRLADAGWLVVRVWEHELTSDVVDRVESAFKVQRPRAPEAG